MISVGGTMIERDAPWLLDERCQRRFGFWAWSPDHQYLMFWQARWSGLAVSAEVAGDSAVLEVWCNERIIPMPEPVPARCVTFPLPCPTY